MYLHPEHPAIRANRLLALLAEVGHLNFVLWALLLHLLVPVHCLQQVSHITDETFAFGEVVQGHYFATMGAFRPSLLNPLSQTFFACDLTPARTHSRFLEPLEADVTVHE